MENSDRPKRNKPCENCRTHRRKCIHFNNSICERCYKLNLECIFIITEKPIKPMEIPLVPIAKGKKLFDAVWYLEEEIHGLQLELSKLRTQPQVKTLPSSSEERWTLTIKKDNRGIHIETSIRSIQDLALFLQQVFQNFANSQPLHPEFIFSKTPAGDQFLRVRHDTKNAESVFRHFFKNRGSNPVAAIEPPPFRLTYANKLDKQLKHQYINSYKVQLVHLYFSCHHYISPIFVYHFHHPQLAANPDCFLSSAIASVVAYSPCIHVPLPKNPVMDRVQFAEYCRLQAKERLEERLFTPNIYTCIGLYLLTFSSLYAMKGSEARLHSGICWSMVYALKDQVDKFTPIELELWKRVYHAERYLEFNMRMLYDGATDFSDITFFKTLGVPGPLQEGDDEISVLCFQALSKLLTNASHQDKAIEVMGLRLMAGVIDVIPSSVIKVLEESLVDLWEGLHPEIQLGNGPYMWMDSVEDCRHPAILRFNASYYVYWMNLQSRVMQDPNTTDLQGAMLSRIDGERALLIVSICSDAVTKLFEQLASVMPCAIELHWLTLCIDILKLLSTSLNKAVQKRANENLAILTGVLKTKLSTTGDASMAAEAPYMKSVRKVISKFMSAKDICCTI